MTDNFSKRVVETLKDLRSSIPNTEDFISIENLSAHESDTTNVHGVADTSLLATKADVSAHESDTTNVHGISDTSILATKEYADNAASSASAAIVDSSPETLNTLNELAAALGDDANFATTVTNSIASKQKTIPLQNTQPNSPSTGDLWVDNAETTKPKLKSYDGSAWVEVGSTVEADSDQIIISTRMFT